MAKSQSNTARMAEELLGPVIRALGYDIWDIEYVKEGSEWYLRITIDSPNGIYIEDCEKVHRAVDAVLDETDPIETPYRLEVSSPGIERDLRTEAHYLACIGQMVILKLFTAHNGKKQLIGTLSAYQAENGTVTLTEKDGTEITVLRSAVSKANVYYEFN